MSSGVAKLFAASDVCGRRFVTETDQTVGQRVVTHAFDFTSCGDGPHLPLAAPRLVTPQNVTPWLSWFLACLLGAVQGADGLLAVLLDKSQFWQRWAGTPMNPRQTLVLNHVLDRAPDAMEVKHDKCQVGRSGQMLAGHCTEGHQRLAGAGRSAQAGGRGAEYGDCVGQIGCAPENAGPLNARMLVLHTLGRIRELSPQYL